MRAAKSGLETWSVDWCVREERVRAAREEGRGGGRGKGWRRWEQGGVHAVVRGGGACGEAYSSRVPPHTTRTRLPFDVVLINTLISSKKHRSASLNRSRCKYEGVWHQTWTVGICRDIHGEVDSARLLQYLPRSISACQLGSCTFLRIDLILSSRVSFQFGNDFLLKTSICSPILEIPKCYHLFKPSFISR